MKVPFSDLTPNMQNKILTLLAYRCGYSGKDFSAEKESLLKKRKTKKVWRNYHWYFMVSIDYHRERMGLEPIYK